MRVYSGPLSRHPRGRCRFDLCAKLLDHASGDFPNRFKSASAVSVLFVRRRFHVSIMTHGVERGERTEGEE